MTILSLGFLFTGKFIANANTDIYETANLSISKIGHNSIQVNWTMPKNENIKSVEAVLNNNFSKRLYVKNNISGTERNWTFNNVSAGVYTAQICFNGSNCNSASSDENSPVNIYIKSVKKPKFNDIAKLSPDFQDQINWIANYGITTGYQDGGYHPSGKVSREQMASFIYRSAGKPSAENIKNPFTDLANNEHKASVLWAVSKGIIQGYDCLSKGNPYKACVKGGTKIFQGGKTINRSQLALEIFRYAGSPLVSDSVREKFLTKISDIGELGNQEKKDAVIWLLEQSIISGYEDGKYRPYNTVSRLQMAKFIAYSSQDLSVVPFLKTEISNPTKFLNTNMSRTDITQVQFSNSLPNCQNPIDVSYGKTAEILACIDGKQIIVGQAGGVIANPKNNQYLFSNFNKNNFATLDFKYLNTGFTKSTAYMFYNSGKINITNYSKDFGKASQDFSSMYEKAILPTDFTFPQSLSSDIANMANMFKEATLQNDLTWFDFNHLNKLNADKTNMFKNFSWKKYFIWVEDSVTQSFLTLDTEATVVNIRIRSQVFLPKENKNSATFLGTNLQRSQITKISFINILPICLNPLNVSPYKWGEILICDNAGELIIGQPGGVIANENSQYLFANLNSTNGVVLDLKYLNVAQNTIFTGMFSKSKISGLFSWPESFGQENLYMAKMFSETILPANFVLPNDFGSKAEYLSYMFEGVIIPQGFNLPANFGKNVIDTSYMFANAKLNADIHWVEVDFTDQTSLVRNAMFENTNWNKHFIWVINDGTKILLSDDTGAAENNFKVIGLAKENANPATFLGTNLQRSEITKISFINTLPICDSPIDVSEKKFGTTLLCYASGEAIIGQRGGVEANENSQYLFANLNSANGVVYDLQYLDMSESTDFTGLFSKSKIPNAFLWPEGFGEKAEYMKYMFSEASFSGSVSFSDNFGKNVRDTSYMFADAKLSGDITWVDYDFTGKTSLIRNAMFKNTNWNESFIWVLNSGTQILLSDDTGAVASNFKIFSLPKENANPATFLDTNLQRSQITKITFINTLPTCAKPIDLSERKLGKILLCYASGEIIIGQPGGVEANRDSQYLFANLNSSNGVVLDLEYLNTANIGNMLSMFSNSKFKSIFPLSAGFGEHVINMNNMFANATLPSNFALPENFGMSAENMNSMFRQATFSDRSFVFPAGFGEIAMDMEAMFSETNFPLNNVSFLGNFGQSAQNMKSMFYKSFLPANLDLPIEFGLSALDMTSMFELTIFKSDINWVGFDFSAKKDLIKTDMFKDAKWNNRVIWVQNIASQDALINGSSATNLNIKATHLIVENENPSNFFFIPNIIRSQISKVSFITTFPICAKPTDISVNSSGIILACLKGSELIIGQPGGVIANPDSKYLFSNLTIANGAKIDLSGLYVGSIDNMDYMFYKSNLSADFSFPPSFGSLATNMSNMFNGANIMSNISWEYTNFTGKKDVNKTNMFASVNWNSYIFWARNLGSLSFLTADTGATNNNIKLRELPNLKMEVEEPTTFLGIQSPIRNEITKLSFVNFLPTCTNPIDVSEKGSGGVLACVSGTEITVGQLGGVILNKNSQYLLSNFKRTAVNLDTTYLEDLATENMSYMFYYGYFSSNSNIVFPVNFGSLAVNMKSMFSSCIYSKKLIFPSGFGNKAVDMSIMFYNSSGVVSNGPVFPKGFGQAAENMGAMFRSVYFRTSLKFPDGFGRLAINMRSMFKEATLTNLLPLPAWFGSKATDLDSMFSGANIPTHFEVFFPAGFGQVATNMNSIFFTAKFSGTSHIIEGFGSKAVDMGYMFTSVDLSLNIYFPAGFGQAATNMTSMFGGCQLGRYLDLPANFGKVANNMSSMFSGVNMPDLFTFPAGFGQSATDMRWMFSGASLRHNIDWQGTSFYGKNFPITDMFRNVKWNGYYVIVKNPGSQEYFTNVKRNSGATTQNIVSAT
ncbi:MAG: S-layer homology domain-containing protein [Bifidobacteriaceae bacterium]|nr:S-layer homology domain-containing protein [Bifidobacteriaceae bacterium]